MVLKKKLVMLPQKSVKWYFFKKVTDKIIKILMRKISNEYTKIKLPNNVFF